MTTNVQDLIASLPEAPPDAFAQYEMDSEDIWRSSRDRKNGLLQSSILYGECRFEKRGAGNVYFPHTEAPRANRDLKNGKYAHGQWKQNASVIDTEWHSFTAYPQDVLEIESWVNTPEDLEDIAQAEKTFLRSLRRALLGGPWGLKEADVNLLSVDDIQGNVEYAGRIMRLRAPLSLEATLYASTGKSIKPLAEVRWLSRGPKLMTPGQRAMAEATGNPGGGGAGGGVNGDVLVALVAELKASREMNEALRAELGAKKGK